MEIIVEGDLDMDENTQRILGDLVTKVEVLSTKIDNMDKIIVEIKSCYVTLLEFRPVQKVVYTIVAIAGLAVIGAIVKLVIIK